MTKKKTGHDDSADLPKRAEETLRESEENYKMLFEGSTQGILATDIETRRFVFANPSMCRMLGYSAAELLKLGVEDIHPKDALAYIMTGMKTQIREGKSLETGIPCLRKDGTVFFADIGGASTIVNGRRCVVGFFTDVTDSKRADEALRASEEKHRTLFETMAQGVVYQNAEGYIISANPAAERTLGLTLDEMLGRKSIDPRWKAIHKDGSDFPGDTHPAMVALRTGKEVRNVIMGVFHPDDNEHVWINIYARPQFKPGSTKPHQVYTIFEDITEPKRAEETLRESEERYRLLTETTQDMIFVIDRDGCVEYMNTTAARALGEQPQNVIGKAHADLFPPEIAEGQWRDLQKVFESGEPFCAESHIIFPHSEMWASAQLVPFRREGGKVTAVLGVSRDTTARKRAEEALRISEAKYRLLVENANELIAVAQDGMLKFVNRIAMEITGFSEQELTSRPFLEFVHPDDRGMVLENYLRRFKGDVFQPRYTFRLMAGDGSIKWLEVSTVLIDWKDKPATLNFFSDVTERKRAEEEIRRKTKELEEKNDELTRFTHAVSHDLRSPLVTIQTFQGYLERDIRSQDAARVEKDLGYIRNAADKMDRLLDDLRRLSRIGRITNPSEEAPLQAIVKEALDLAAGRITGRGVRIDLTEEPVVLYGDRTRLVEVFLNLVENAVKFMGDEPAPRIEIGVEQAGEELVLHVRDNGIGIDPELQPLVFGMFHKLDPETEGEGIGLALVRRIVEMHGGRIWVESEGLGKGATFRFTLAKTRRRRAEEEKL